MKTYFHEETLKYDGTQLRSHFAYDNFNILGDSVVGFIGPCDVPTAHMVDLEDVHQNKFIYSESMLHFIAEHFTNDLPLVVAYQRLLIDLIIEEMHDSKDGLRLVRMGDDIFDSHFKLSVSIATKSPVSCLIHVGVNIVSTNTPVLTKGLLDYGLSPQATATGVLNRYRAEIESMKNACAKVRGVL